MKCPTCNGEGIVEGHTLSKVPMGGKFQNPGVGAGLKGMLKPPVKNPGSRSKGIKYLAKARRFTD